MLTRLAWFAYCVLLLLLGYGRMIERIMIDSGGPWSRFGPPLAAMIVCIGIVAWLRGRALGFLSFWRLVHGVLIAAILALGTYGAILLGIRVTSGAVSLLVIAIALLPAGMALYRYAYRSVTTWHGARE